MKEGGMMVKGGGVNLKVSEVMLLLMLHVYGI